MHSAGLIALPIKQSQACCDLRECLTPVTHVPLLFMQRWQNKHVSSLETYGKFTPPPQH